MRKVIAAFMVASAWLVSGAQIAPAPTPPPASNDVVAAKAAELLRSGTIMGNRNGNVTIIKFFDYDCTYCKAVEPRVAQLLRSDKNVKVVVKEFPILTPASLTAAKAALASVKQGKYAAYHTALMKYEGAMDNRAIFDTAETVGLNVERLRRDMAAPEIAEEIIANFNLARSLRLFQTPAFIINNRIVTGPSAEINFPKLVAEARTRK